jgi:Malectin domain/Bacterial TSP3 repeat
VYHTDPTKADTDGDGIPDGAEMAFWGANWNADPDGDGKINLLDADSDNNGVTDGVERSQGTNPADPKPVPQTGSVILAVNAGGSPFTAADNTAYQADALVSGGSTYKTTAAITGTADDALYQSERYGNFTYNVPVATGDYVVTLKFAEIYFSAPGRRLFDVLIEGGTVISKLDIFAQAGQNTAYDVTVAVRVTDGALTITFRNIVDKAKVSAILIKTP